MTKKDEEKLVEKFLQYDKRKWINRSDQIKQKEKKIDKEISQFFRPHISKSSKRLAVNKRNKESTIITGGKVIQSNSTKNTNSLEFRFERLYNDSKIRQEKKQKAMLNETVDEKSKQSKNTYRKAHREKIVNNNSLHYNESTNTNNKISPITSTENIYQLSPEYDERTRSIIRKYTQEGADNDKTLSSFKNPPNNSNGANSPWEFITWNESKYQSK